ncbi:hypothetical protein HUE56_20730 [Azospirillum oryzae]|uniref:Agenet-like domain-containing protein n=1 Tax=Azospirillum oryzae TaxID=286727 RepID=A0A6N1AU48_9PROT|nr:hypothetical protein [Azospirillum oryzae]KAA0591492.1 hypothetical protein FZ938_05320 [Azospirillum oryzae]QKS52784.1 hypothetical protein HUE56_20730 [Azospirillum oryzae]GLR80440.1 hypothetical protein GCM10007856_31180 [Azospirillum oryzae]
MLRLLTLCLAVMALLSACGPVYETQYSLVPPSSAEGRLCVNQCQQNRNYCRQNCGMSQQACVNEARSRALYEYQSYVNRQQAEKKPIKKSVSDFDRSYSCGNSSCEARCEADYRDCFGGSCGGQVIAKRVCTAFCDQEKPAPAPAAAPMLSPIPPGASPSPMATAPAAGYQAGASLCQPGMRVEVQWKGDWYPATVKDKPRKDGRCPVHYDEYSTEDDEAVSLRRIRPR